MKVLVILAVSTVCAVSAATSDLSSPLVDAAARKPEKRGIGLGYGLSGLGYDAHQLGYSVAGYHPAAAAGYVAPVAHTTVIKSGYAVPAATTGYLGGYDGLGKYTGYTGGFYPAGYTTGYNGYSGYGGYGGYGAIPVVAGTGYGKIVQPAAAAATTSYSKVIHSYPHYSSTVGVAPAIGYSGLAAGYHYGY
ncbi:hypothetical protein quinque_000765 [Culex quinquefasciatus]